MIESQTRVGRRDCILFKEAKAENSNYLKIVDAEGCKSLVGKNKDERPQSLSLDISIGCVNKTVIAHELVHALGFDHEHNRPDRDEWIEIFYDNLKQSGQFKKIEKTVFQDLQTPYDYKSIMHYPVYNDHAKDQQRETMRAIRPPFEIEPSELLSDIDILEIRKLYNCKLGK